MSVRRQEGEQAGPTVQTQPRFVLARNEVRSDVTHLSQRCTDTLSKHHVDGRRGGGGGALFSCWTAIGKIMCCRRNCASGGKKKKLQTASPKHKCVSLIEERNGGLPPHLPITPTPLP